MRAQAIIYVVDSTDTERISISREEFHAILEEEELKDSLILVYANKQVRRGWDWPCERAACMAATCEAPSTCVVGCLLPCRTCQAR